MRWRPAKTCLRKEQGQGREGLSVLESASSSGIAGDPGACGWARGPAGPEGTVVLPLVVLLCGCKQHRKRIYSVAAAAGRRLPAPPAPGRIKEEWDFVAECRRKGVPQAQYCKNGFVDTNSRILDKIERNSVARQSSWVKDRGKQSNPFVFELSGAQWKELPDSLKEQTHLKEWHIHSTLIQTIPAYIELFQAMRILDLPENQITCLPAEIGRLKNLKELNVSFNHLRSIPPELGDCENLERLDCSGNLDLMELPFELSNLKQVTFVDISANNFSSVPICVLRMCRLQWLDISSNNLSDLPQDIDRLEELQSFLLYKNKLTYLPQAMLNLKKLTLLVVSGDHLVELPTALCDASTPLKFVSLMDNPIDKAQCQDSDETIESEQDRQHFDKEFMKAYIEDLKERGLCLARRAAVRWCAVSRFEAQKCSRWQKAMKGVDVQPLSCVKRSSTSQCIKAIVTNKADAMTLDGGKMFDAGMPPYKLRPMAAEVYGTKEPVSKFFSMSCVPGANKDRFPNLCSLCAGTGANKCASSREEPYSGYAGAFKCLRDNAGDVAFTRGSTILEELPDKAERDQYKLLCPDNTWKSVEEYKECHLAQVPSHAVVARSVRGKEDAIWELLSQAQEKFGKNKASEFQLFASPSGQKDLLFKDSAIGFLRVPPKVDVGLYLTFNYITSILNLRKSEQDVAATRARVMWCAVGSEEKHKCDQWSRVSNGTVTCTSFPTTEDCITSIMVASLGHCGVGSGLLGKGHGCLLTKGDADAMSLDGGYIYTAGKCGLFPVLAENQRYFAVAAVRKQDTGFRWSSVRGKKSCHTAVGRTAGWNIPVGLLVNQTRSCKFDEFFSQSCAPGADPKSNLCALCIGDERGENKCAANSNERYHGYTGALRCLAEKAGDVAFLKDSTVLQNTDGKNTHEWARNLRLEDFELLCLDDTRKPVTEAKNCHLAIAPNHAVVSRMDKVEYIQKVMINQQKHFGNTGSRCPGEFCLFRSETKNLLFNDNTECLAKLHGKTTYEKYLGKEYVIATANLNQCSSSALLEACAFLTQ
ncbi:lactotransferrin [Cricetulus griseus]